MKKVNPEDLVVGQEYYVKLKFDFKDKGLRPLGFTDILEDDYWYHKDQPIYTAEQVATLEVKEDNARLKMVVEVATALYVAHGTTADGKNTFMPDRDQIAHEALELITACEEALKEVER